ncbi:MAG TPA: sugar transferase [Ktedonobacteraceae bacterium]|nr:sugar transferase [Ktedonobacteraceae bacterium]
MADILFVTPYYPPEKAAPAVRISETASLLVQKGYQVTVLTTFPNYPSGIVAPEYHGCLRREEVLDGVRVIRVWSYITANKGFFRRILAQLSFGCLAPLIGGKALGSPGIVIVESPPLFDAIAARTLSWLKGCPFIFIVSDLWPESAVQLGVLRNRLFIRLAEWLEWSTYQRAGFVWAVTEGIREILIRRGFDAERVFVLTNGVDTRKFCPLPQAQARAELELDDGFTVLYAGTHGLAHGLMTVLDAAEMIRDQEDVHLLLVGDGAAKADLVAAAKQRGLTNVTFLDPFPHQRMPLLLASADVCLVPLRKVPLFQGALPSKIYEIMACARPIILGVEGEACTLVVDEAKAAIAVEPENANALGSAILHFHQHPEVAEAMGQRGRAFVETRFNRHRLVETLEGYLIRLLDEPAPISFPAFFYRCWCKILDVIAGFSGSLLLCLLLPILATLIYLDSPGPIFYSQERLGRYRRPFRMYKLRSMHPEASRVGHMTWATERDPRITRVGRILRATHIDELPQAWNILRGEISLIGPRPELPVFANKLEKAIPNYRRRFFVKPGLTGWAQVQYHYGDTEQDEQVKLTYDLYYIDHRSVILDISILLKTVVEVVMGHGR